MRWLLIVVACLVTVAFAWFYNTYDPSQVARNQIAEVGGRKLDREDFLRTMRLFGLARDMGLYELIQPLAAGPAPEPEQNFVFNLLVLRNASEDLGIHPAAESIKDAQRRLPVFQDAAGAFDPVKLGAFMERSLAPRGFTERQMDEVMADLLRLRTMSGLIGATAPLATAEARQLLEIRERSHTVGIISISRADPAEMEISEENITARYGEAKDQLRTEEARIIKIASAALPADEAALEGRDRIAALQKLADRSFAFSQAILEEDADFDALAATAGFAVQTTPAFTAAKPPEAFSAIPDAASVAFALTEENPSSDVLATNDAFHVLHLETIEPSRPLTPEEARPQIVEALRTEAASSATAERAESARTAIQKALDAGRPLADAAAESGLEARILEPFTLAEPPMDDPNARMIVEAAADLPQGRLSPFLPTADGGILLCVVAREDASAETVEQELERFASRLELSRRQMAFAEWLRIERDRQAARFLAPNAQG